MSQGSILVSNDASSQTLDTDCDIAKAAPPKGLAFWMAFSAVLVSLSISVLDMCAIPTSLPTIVQELSGGEKFIWVGAAYALSSTAVLLLCGRLADIFGRRPVMLTALALFALGSALAGAAKDMNMLIAARVVQGMGGGAIYTMSNVITADLVPLSERPTYQAVIVAAYGFSAGIGPLVGGALTQKASWRWIFYINLPLTGISFAMVAIFLRVQTPSGAIVAKLARMDWFGNALIAAGTTLTLIGITWYGVIYPFKSVHVLVPFVLGLCLIFAFFAYEILFMKEPRADSDGDSPANSLLSHPATLPVDILSNRTSAFAYLGVFCHGMTSIAAIYYLPTFFQACQASSPIRSSVQTLPLSFVISPFGLLCGIIVKRTRKYVPVNFVGWAITVVGFGLLTLLRPESTPGQWVGFPVVMSAGTGLIYASTVYPTLAPLSVTRNAAALAFFIFCRTFAQTWGITISGVILQNQLKAKLPSAFLATLDPGVDITFAAIPAIPMLEEPLRSEVQTAFAQSLAVIWKVAVGISGLGFLSVFLLKELPMATYTDERYGLEQLKKKDVEHGAESTSS